LARLEYLPARGVELDIAKREGLARRVRSCPAPKHGPHPRGELARRKRFCYVVVGAEIEPDDPVGLLAASREEDHRQARPLPDPPAEGEPIDPGHHHVEDDEGRLAFLDQRASGIAVGGGQRLEALVLEVADDDIAHDGFVFDDENGRHASYCGSGFHLLWWRRAQSSLTVPSVIPRSACRVAGWMSAR